MKTWQKLAATAAIVIVIAVVALYTRSNWGGLADSAVNTVVKSVTGMDIGYDGFSGTDNSGTDNSAVDAGWD